MRQAVKVTMPPKGCVKLAKAILIIYNLVFLLCGAAILSLGIWMHFDYDAFGHIHVFQGTTEDILYEKIAFVFIGIGGGILLISFLGCCGAVSENICFLCLYSFLILLVILLEATCVTLFSIWKDKVKIHLMGTMRKQVLWEYNNTGNATPESGNRITVAWNALQVQLECCGTKGPANYKDSQWLSHTPDLSGEFVPSTCCVLENKDHKNPQPVNYEQCQVHSVLSSSDPAAHKYIHATGCLYKIMQRIHASNTIVISVTVGVIVFQVFCFLLTCCAMSCIRRRQAESPWYEDDDEEEE